MGGQDEGIGKSRAGNTSRIHLAVDACGLPVVFDITGGQVNDCTQALALIAKMSDRHHLLVDWLGSHAYLVTPAMAEVAQYDIGAANGSIDPEGVQQVPYGETRDFDVSPSVGYAAYVTGCDGALASGKYHTSAIKTDCQVMAAFLPQ